MTAFDKGSFPLAAPSLWPSAKPWGKGRDLGDAAWSLPRRAAHLLHSQRYQEERIICALPSEPHILFYPKMKTLG